MPAVRIFRLIRLSLFIAAGAAGPVACAATAAPDRELVRVSSLEELRACGSRSGLHVRMNPGTYTVDRAESRRFFRLTGHDSIWDLTGVTLRVDTALFRQFGPRDRTGAISCVFSIEGSGIEFRGVRTENFGDLPGIQSRNKIFDITGSDVVLRDVDVTTSGSSPWGYGSLYGISGGEVRKMNGIRVGWPARNVRLSGCRVHMRAMGHGIFIQGARDTRIDDCHVDGLLRLTNEILAESRGYAFERKFKASGRDYSEGVSLGPEGQILPDEIIALSEDGIRLYDAAGPGQPTGRTTIVNCTVTRMRRGFCTALGGAPDSMVNCEARECVAVGFNVGTADQVERCRSDARYGEAVSIVADSSHDARVDLEILDSRGGLANDLLAVINGRSHHVILHTADPAFVPASFTVARGSRRGYAHYQRPSPAVREIELQNSTPARVVTGDR